MGRKTRSLRAWMMSVPVDLAAFLLPLVWYRLNWKSVVVAALVSSVLFAMGGLYNARRHLAVLDDLPALIGRMLVAAALVSIVVSERHGSFENVSDFLRIVAISGALVIVARSFTYRAMLLARRRRWVEHGAVILGRGPVATELARLLRRYPQYGLRFAGFIDVDDKTGTAVRGHEEVPVLGLFEDVEELVKKVDCDVVIVADIDVPETQLISAVRSKSLINRDLWMVPRLREFSSYSGNPDHVGAIPLVRVRRPILAGPKWAVKRFFDIVLSALALLVLSPVLLICAIAVRLEGGPGIFFRQQRVGRYGVPFKLVKFRSMRPVNEAESQTNWSIGYDPRVGPVGKILRRTSLDELPQLWNILRGDMTIVGPRPERPYFVDQFSAEFPDYAMRHRAPVGLTGLAQVSGLRGDTPISDRARFDNYYIENWSIWLDVKVVVRTVAEVFRAGGR